MPRKRQQDLETASVESNIPLKSTGQATVTPKTNKNAMARRTGRAVPPLKVSYKTQKLRLKYAERLLTEALDRMLADQPPIYGRTWTTCLKIKRFLKNGSLSTTDGKDDSGENKKPFPSLV